jgi:hypothetical protein
MSIITTAIKTNAKPHGHQHQLKAAMETNVAKLSRKIALVTGASSGIGEAIVQQLATAGYKVYGTSRRGARSGLVARLQGIRRSPMNMLTFYTRRPKGYTDYPVLSLRKTAGTHSALRRPLSVRRKLCR